MSITETLERTSGPGLRHGRGVPDEAIRAVENRVGVTFPASYREFLRTFGWIISPTVTVYGLGADVPGELSVLVNVDLERTEEPGSAIPPHLIPICPDGMGNHECLDTAHGYEGDCPVVVWLAALGPEQEPAEVAPSFDVWLRERFPAPRRAETGRAAQAPLGIAAGEGLSPRSSSDGEIGPRRRRGGLTAEDAPSGGRGRRGSKLGRASEAENGVSEGDVRGGRGRGRPRR